MRKLTPIGALILCCLIGIIVGKPGLWFPLGLVAMMAIAMIQKRSGPSEP